MSRKIFRTRMLATFFLLHMGMIGNALGFLNAQYDYEYSKLNIFQDKAVLRLIVKDNTILDSAEELSGRVEIFRLENTFEGDEKSGLVQDNEIEVDDENGLILHIDSLDPKTVYRIRVWLVRNSGEEEKSLGRMKDWFYLVTEDDDALSKARARIVMIAFSEWYDWERQVQNRYGKPYYGSGWCDNFYYWTLEYVLHNNKNPKRMGANSFPVLRKRNISIHGDSASWARGGGKKYGHIFMVLAYHPGKNILWCLDGNHGDRVTISNRTLVGSWSVQHIVETQVKDSDSLDDSYHAHLDALKNLPVRPQRRDIGDGPLEKLPIIGAPIKALKDLFRRRRR